MVGIQACAIIHIGSSDPGPASVQNALNVNVRTG